MENRSTLESGLEAIYLGNLGTVEADLILPGRMKDGIPVIWHSTRPEFLEDNGKVHRPASSEGNQTVILRASATSQGITVSRDYQVTILALPAERRFVRQIPIKICSRADTLIRLPGCVILELEDGIVSLPVRWEHDGIVKVSTGQSYEITGRPDRPEDSWSGGGDTFERKYRILNMPRQVKACITGLPEDACESTTTPAKKVWEVTKNRVTLLEDGKFTEDIDRMLHYILSFSADSLLYSFRAAAGLATYGAIPMTGWESPESNLRGHTAGHYLSALALAYDVTGEERLRKRAEELIRGLYEVQRTYTSWSEEYDGYLSAYTMEQFSGLEQGEVYPAVWAPYYTLHKIMAGLLDCYKTFQQETALLILKRMGLWIHKRLAGFTRGALNKMWFTYIAGEFGGINETLAQLYLLTEDERFLEAARMFDNDTLFYPMSENIDVLGGLHANQHIPQMIGALRLFEADGQTELLRAACHFWDMVSAHHSYASGGVGNTEMFCNADRIGSELSEKNTESCCSYNMLKLTKNLFEYHPEVKYADYYEQVLLNHILANSASKYGGATTYFMGMQPGSQKQFRTMENTCCHGTGLESKFRYGEGIYYISAEDIYINLFLNSTLTLEDGFILVQEVHNPQRSKISFTIRKSTGTSKTIKIRIPYWCGGKYNMFCSKKFESVQAQDGYLVFRDKWEEDDRITVEFACFLHMTHPQDHKEMFSVFYGPFLLALLNDREEFLVFEQRPEELIKHICQTGDLTFGLKGYELKPFYQVVDEKYHIYMKYQEKEGSNA